MNLKQLQKMASQARKLDIGTVSRFLNEHGVRYKSTEPPSCVLEFLAGYPLHTFPLAQCRSNAVRLALDAAEAGLTTRYIEGLARHGQGTLELLHSWNVVQNTLVDVTWGELVFEQHLNAILVHRANRVVGTIPSGYSYLGIEIPVETAVQSDKFIIGRNI
jgi:hypothetical protein